MPHTASYRLGLIVNPVAGLGGRVGLKGSDGEAIQQRARAWGAVSEAPQRTIAALRQLLAVFDRTAAPARLTLLTCPGVMGEDTARACGLLPVVLDSIRHAHTTAEDTRQAATEMERLGANLILFAGGDGTARDIYHAVGDRVTVLGIPAGVKIHSSVYAINPLSAGQLAGQYLLGQINRVEEAEVLDLDEDAYRQGVVSPQLYGYLTIPHSRRLVQARKSPSPASSASIQAAIALSIVDRMRDDTLYIVGPGTTTRSIFTALALPKTLIGVDALWQRRVASADTSEATLLELLAQHPRAALIVTPTGGQGFIFGRGNQPISPAVIRQVGRDNITVVCPWAKLETLQGRPLLVDTGDQATDDLLSGYFRVITGYDEQIMYRAGADPDHSLPA